jgi:diguanylate cyclase (GGDEF)-like protein
MEHLDIESISSLQGHLANISGLSLSLYGEKGNVILPPVNEDRLLTAFRSSSKGRDEYNNFVRQHLEKALHRNDISFFKGPVGQYHFFIPFHIGNSVFMIVGGGVFLSAEDFENFSRQEGPSYGFMPHQLKSWHQEISIRDYADVQDTARYIRSIFSLLLKSSYQSTFHEKRYRLVKTLFSVISDLKLEKRSPEIYDLLEDIFLFLFNAESISIMSGENGSFKTQRAAGRFKDHLQSLTLRATGLVSKVIETRNPLYSESVMDILRLGFDDKVTSVYLFPILSADKVIGILNIVNSDILKEDADLISEICRITGSVFRIMELQETYDKYLKEIDVLNTAIARLIPLKEPDMLYESILEMSISLAEAEKGSLMLVNEDASCLTIKAAKGIHKRLLSDIKIKAGEGIAGWVYREGMPLIMDDIEKNDRGFPRRHKYKTGSFISIPLKLGEQTIGVLNISDKITGEVFSEEDMVLLRSFASYVAIALERSTYYSLAGHLKELSITDPLTGLFNRRYFEDRFFEELHRSDRHNLFFSLAMIDIDDFKLFNDSEGHLAGDEVLKGIANIAKDCLRVSDVIARFGGEEFTVIMPQTEKEEAMLVAERIRKSIKEQIPSTWNVFPRNAVTVSIGIATFPSDGKDRKELIRNADKALYMAKMEGKDRTVQWRTGGTEAKPFSRNPQSFSES